MKYLILLGLLVGCNRETLEGRCFIDYYSEQEFKVLTCNDEYCQVVGLIAGYTYVKHRSSVEKQIQITCPKE